MRLNWEKLKTWVSNTIVLEQISVVSQNYPKMSQYLWFLIWLNISNWDLKMAVYAMHVNLWFSLCRTVTHLLYFFLNNFRRNIWDKRYFTITEFWTSTWYWGRHSSRLDWVPELSTGHTWASVQMRSERCPSPPDRPKPNPLSYHATGPG